MLVAIIYRSLSGLLLRCTKNENLLQANKFLPRESGTILPLRDASYVRLRLRTADLRFKCHRGIAIAVLKMLRFLR